MPHFMVDDYKVHVGKIVCVTGSNEGDIGESFYIKPQSSISVDGSILELGKGQRSSYSMMLGIAMGERAGDDSRSLMRSILGYGVMLDHHLCNNGPHPDIDTLRKPLISGKDGFCSISEFMSAKEVGDPYSLEAYLQVNDEEQLVMSTRDIPVSIEDALSFITRHITLYPGDIVGIWLDGVSRPVNAGDLIECGISGISTLTVRIEDSGTGK